MLEVGIRIELITVEQCYGVAVHPLTIRATDQFLFSTADRFYAMLLLGVSLLQLALPPARHVKIEFVTLGFFRFRFHPLGRPFEFVYSGYSQSRSACPL